MKIAVVGLGAIGGVLAAWLGSRLAPGRVQLSALARGATLQAVRAQGLLLETDAGPQAVAVQASDDPAQLGVQDLVIVAVKGPALAAVAPAVARLMGPQTLVLTAMNGVPWWFFDGLPGACQGLHLDSVDPGGVARAHIPSAQVVGAVTSVRSATVAPPSPSTAMSVTRWVGRASVHAWAAPVAASATWCWPATTTSSRSATSAAGASRRSPGTSSTATCAGAGPAT